ncbi:DUF4174 domain-containing protein [Enterovibrio sp. Hal110]
MHLLLTICLVLFAGFGAVPNASAYPEYGFIKSHRTLLFFAPSKDEKVEAFERQMLIHGCQMDDRDLHPVILNIQDLADSRGIFTPEEILEMYDKYRVANEEHIAVLIGKDGTEKFRWQQNVDIEELVKVIDEMPMRRREMTRQVSRCSA